MYVTKDNDRLYLTSWGYNALLILGELAEIVKARGGRVKPAKTALISNRAIESAKLDLAGKIESIEETNRTAGHSDKRDQAILDLRGRLAELESIKNDPIPAYGQSWINFTLDGKVFYLSMDDNPFFDFHFVKTPLRTGDIYSQDAVCDAFDKSWLSDELLGFHASDEDRREAAQSIFDFLDKAEDSPVVVESKKVRVPNTYDGGWHMETVRANERVARLDY